MKESFNGRRRALMIEVARILLKLGYEIEAVLQLNVQ